MRKVLTVFALIIIGFISFGQSRLGSSANEIKSEFYGSKYNLKEAYDKDRDYYIKIDDTRATVLYYFSSNRICNATVIAPDNQGALNYYVERYNKLYVILSSTTWKMYSNGGVSNIELVYPDSGGYFFVWKNL